MGSAEPTDMWNSIQKALSNGTLMELDTKYGFSNDFSQLGVTMAKLQKLSDSGVLIIGYYNNPAEWTGEYDENGNPILDNGTDHVFFVGNSNLTISSTSYAGNPYTSNANGLTMSNAAAYQKLVVVQGGTFTPVVLIPFATNNWEKDPLKTRKDYLRNPYSKGDMHFYTVVK